LTPKRLGSAVVRNRLRRRMREVYRRQLTPVTGANHEIWLAKSAATRLSYAQLGAAMSSLRGTTK
jgi:ribonuclease P protein component